MSTTIRLVNELDDEHVRMDCVAGREQADSRAWPDEARWTTKQVIAACLWAAFFGLGCGYGWLFFQLGTATCR
jgi:hypothetical protein